MVILIHMVAGGEGEEEPGHCVPEEIPASLPCLTAGWTGEKPSPATVSVSLLPTHYTVPLEEDTEILVDLGIESRVLQRQDLGGVQSEAGEVMCEGQTLHLQCWS